MWRYLVRASMTTFQRGRSAIWFMTRPRAFGVHAAVLTPAGKIVLIRQTYSPGWRFPGGGLKRRETPGAAIVRELQEELGLRCFGAIHHVCNFEHRPEHRRGLAALFLVTDATYQARRSLEIDDIAEFAPCSLPPDATAMTRELLQAIAASPFWPLELRSPSGQACGGSARILPPELTSFDH